MNEIDKLLIDLLKLDGNETNLMTGYEKILWERLIIVLNQIRFYDYKKFGCGNIKCPCSPFYELKKIVGEKDFINKLCSYIYGFDLILLNKLIKFMEE